ncbi:hypothetical protein BS78_06G192400 [Paspalum vaginatum]|nr:hypothetical protein BS78_06G192400 [Paspalum vaginatum]
MYVNILIGCAHAVNSIKYIHNLYAMLPKLISIFLELCICDTKMCFQERKRKNANLPKEKKKEKRAMVIADYGRKKGMKGCPMFLANQEEKKVMVIADYHWKKV